MLNIKLSFIIFISAFCLGCRNKSGNVVCRTVQNSPYLIDCYSKKDKYFRFYFNKNKEVQYATTIKGKGYGVIEFNKEGLNHLKSVENINIIPEMAQPLDHFQLWYDSEGKVTDIDMYHEGIYESYNRTKVNNGHRYQVEYYLPNVKEYVPLYHFTLSDKGELLPDFFFYKKNEDNSYSILTDDNEILIKYGKIDSLQIAYNELKMKDMEFVFVKERDAFFPTFYEDKTEIIRNLDSSIRFENEPSIIGVLWCFFSKGNQYKTRYNLLIFNGDLMSRVKQYSYLFDKYEKKYPTGKISELKDLKKSLLQVGFIEKNGGFEPSSDLLEKVQSVIDGNKNNAHIKGS